MDPGFRGDVVDFYHRFRRGYPPAVIDLLVDVFGLTRADVVADLGCGTGQLTLPVAERVGAVVGVDPEPDMLSRARLVARERAVPNVGWMVGDDSVIATLVTLLGAGRLGAVTIGQALHWMGHEALFRVLPELVRPGGGVAVVTNGVPLWLHDEAWSRALRAVLEDWLGRELTDWCGSDEASQHRYRDGLLAAGFDVTGRSVVYTDELTVDQVVGGVLSAMPADVLPPPEQRHDLAHRIERAIRPHGTLVERVDVRVLAGRT